MVCVGVCVGGGWASALGFSLSLSALSFGSVFFISYGCAHAHARHARAHNSDMSDATDATGTTDGTDETDMSDAFSHTRAVHTSSLRVRTHAPTTSRIEFHFRSVKVLVKAMIDSLRGKKFLMRKPHLASR